MQTLQYNITIILRHTDTEITTAQKLLVRNEDDLHDFTELRVGGHELSHEVGTRHHLLNKWTVEQSPHHFWMTDHLDTIQTTNKLISSTSVTVILL